MTNAKNSRVLRNRAIRAVAGGLLMSSLNDEDLKKLASDLDLEFLEALRELLLSLPLRAEPYIDYARERISYESTGLANAIYDRVKARRLSKDRVTSYMRQINPRISKDFGELKLPLKDLIRQFVELGTPEHVNRLLSLVSGRLEQDAYLTGITTRK